LLTDAELAAIAAAAIRMSRGVLEMARNRDSAALAAFQAVERARALGLLAPSRTAPATR